MWSRSARGLKASCGVIIWLLCGGLSPNSYLIPRIRHIRIVKVSRVVSHFCSSSSHEPIVYHLNCRRVMCMIFHILVCIILSYEWVSNSNILMNDENYRRHWMPATGHIAIAAWEDVYTLQSLSTNFQWVLFKVEPCLVQIKTVWW